MRPYDTGDPELDARIHQLAEDAVAAHAPSHPHNGADIVAELMVSALKLHRDDADRGDLKLVNAAVKEMRYSFLVFRNYRAVPKVTVFGSARTQPNQPNYEMAASFASHMADQRGWMVVTGAGPGIMEAANLGAGVDDSFGVNIRLPFEAEANPYIHESRLINFKYFFTRKLMFMKESNAFALFPGGFGTQDETFELLTLIQTGKSPISPVVLIDAPGTSYWDRWLDFVSGTLVEQGMIGPDDMALFTQVDTVEAAAAEVCDFYRNYHSQRFIGDRLVLRLQHAPSAEQLERLNDEFSDILASGQIETTETTDAERNADDHPDLARIILHFNRRSLGRLRIMIDTLNGFAPEIGTVSSD
jgi:uncharacterized protein (TIGR00730 family)